VKSKVLKDSLNQNAQYHSNTPILRAHTYTIIKYKNLAVYITV